MDIRFSFSRFLLFALGLWVLGACTPVTPTFPVVTQEPGAPLIVESPYPPPVTNTPPPTFVPTNTAPAYVAPATATPVPTQNWIHPLDSTPKPITYSLTSTENWFVYTNTEYGFSLRYPEFPPKEHEPFSNALAVFSLTIRTGPTVPRSSANIAHFQVHIFPNDTMVSSQDAVVDLMGLYNAVPETTNPIGLAGEQALYNANAVFSMAFREESDGRLFFTAIHGPYIYVIGEAIMTDRGAQSFIYELFLSTFQFDN